MEQISGEEKELEGIRGDGRDGEIEDMEAEKIASDS